MNSNSLPWHPGTKHTPQAGSPGSPRNPITISTTPPPSVNGPAASTSSNSLPVANPPTTSTTTTNSSPRNNQFVLLRDLSHPVSSNTTRVLIIDPSPTCQFCPPVIAHYHNRRQLVTNLEQQLTNLQCTNTCDTSRDQLIRSENRTSQNWIFQYMQTHLRTHPQCGTITDIPRY